MARPRSAILLALRQPGNLAALKAALPKAEGALLLGQFPGCENDWQVIDARLDLAYMKQVIAMLPEERAALERAERLKDRASGLFEQALSGRSSGPTRSTPPALNACNISASAAAADRQAIATGVDLAGYTRKVYVMPGNTCPGAGFGTPGGTPSSAWVFACDLKGVYAHALGHDFGMDHASTDSQEYGDTTDPMTFSSTALRGLNAPHRQQLGWFAATPFDQAGEDDLAALALDPAAATAPQVLTIRKPDTSECYYRVAAGFDSYIDSRYDNRLSVHRTKGMAAPPARIC